MRLSRSFGASLGLLVPAFALVALTALPTAAKADDNNDWDWKSSSDKDKSSSDKDKFEWKTEDGNQGWITKDDDGSVRVYAYKRSQPAAAGGGYLGVQVQDVTRALQRAKDLKTSEGALVNEVEDGSPADEAGIRRGDVIISLNGKGIGDSEDLIGAVRDLDPGDKARVEVERDGARQTISVTVGERSRRLRASLPPGFGRGMWQSRGNDDDNDVPRQMMRLHQDNMEELNAQIRELQKQIDQLTEQLRGLREELRRMDSDRTPSRDRDDRDE